MNPHITDLAKHPRGRRWRSRLIPYDADIRRMRQEGASYQFIAAWISEQGLRISGSAVHAYVRARARRGQSEYQLPVVQCPKAAMHFSPHQNLLNPSTEHMHSADNMSTRLVKEFVYTGRSEEHNPLGDADLSFNDPLANSANE